MVFLRSEEHLEHWLGASGWEPGTSMSAPTLNELARRWWWTRLEPDWRPRSPDESQAILDELGLSGAFWQLVPVDRDGADDEPDANRLER
jgi:hypothetical protein